MRKVFASSRSIHRQIFKSIRALDCDWSVPTVIGRLVLIGIDRPAAIGREGDKDTSGYISGDTGRFSSEFCFALTSNTEF